MFLLFCPLEQANPVRVCKLAMCALTRKKNKDVTEVVLV